MGTYTDQTWYHIARTPQGLHVHRLDPAAVSALAGAALASIAKPSDADRESAEADAVGKLVEGVRRELGFPTGDEAGWSSSLGPGEPHPSTLSAAVNVASGIPDA